MLVMKFGGASVAKTESFLKIADLIIEKSKLHKKIVVVVSAMGNTTDQLIQLAREVHPNPPAREQDMLISVGERISISLLAMALSLKHKRAVSFTGSQSGIITSSDHSDAKIVDVKPNRLLPVLNKEQIAIVAGFQGVSRQGEITTLGRGGSDTTAVALAVALGAERVEFYKDVPGIYNEDPKRNPNALHIKEMSYEDVKQIADRGGKILHKRCIELAQKNGVQIAVHSFENPSEGGTLVGASAQRSSEKYYEDEPCLPN